MIILSSLALLYHHWINTPLHDFTFFICTVCGIIWMRIGFINIPLYMLPCKVPFDITAFFLNTITFKFCLNCKGLHTFMFICVSQRCLNHQYIFQHLYMQHMRYCSIFSVWQMYWKLGNFKAYYQYVFYSLSSSCVKLALYLLSTCPGACHL